MTRRALGWNLRIRMERTIVSVHVGRAGVVLLLLACSVQAAGAEPVALHRFHAGPSTVVERWCDPEEAWVAWVAQIDLRNPSLALTVLPTRHLLTGLVRPSELCESDPRAVLAVNGDYFDESGVPVGICMRDGKLIKTGRGWSYLVILPDGRAGIGRGEPDLRLVTSHGDTVVLGGLNPCRPPRGAYARTTSGTREAPSVNYKARRTLCLMGALPWPHGQVDALVHARVPDHFVEREENPVLMLEKAPPAIAADDTVRLIVDAPKLLGLASEAIGGGPRIVRSGGVSVEYGEEGTSESHALDRHPRSAVGISDNGELAWLVVADGRRPGHSRGMDLWQLARFMVALGCWDALNLDGGGSSVMVAGGRPLNAPSDALGERPVANILAVIRTDSPGDTASLRISSPTHPLACAGLWRPEAWWLDDRGWVLGRVTDGIWNCDRSLGVVSDDGYLSPRGEGRLRIRAGRFEDSVSLSCRTATQTLIYPPILSEASGPDQPVIMARDSQDLPLTAGGRVMRKPGGITVDSGVLGLRTISVIEQLSWQPIEPSGPHFACVGESVGLPYMFSDDSDTTWFRIAPRLDAASLRLRLRADGRGVHVGVGFVDSLGYRYRGELTSATGGAYWKGWRLVTLDAADCTSGAGRPATLPLRLEGLFAWPGAHPARAGTLWVQSLAAGAPHRAAAPSPGG